MSAGWVSDKCMPAWLMQLGPAFGTGRRMPRPPGEGIKIRNPKPKEE